MEADPKKRKVAVFDFDGTLFRGDSFIKFTCFALRKKHILYSLTKNIPSLMAWKLGLFSNEKAKQRLFRTLFKGMSQDEFIHLCQEFCKNIESDIDMSALDCLRQHVKQGDSVYIISASPAEWIRPWAEKEGVTQVIGTQISFENGFISGDFSSPNCYGEEKVNRLNQIEKDREAYFLTAYGDSKGDYAMFSYSDNFKKVHHSKSGGKPGNAIWEGAGFGMLITLSLILIITGIIFISRSTISPFIAISAIIFGLATAFFRGGWKSFIIMLILILLSFILSHFTFDTVYDSLSYHKWTVYFLSHGWNPIYDPDPTDILWIMHYSRAQEILSASVASITGILESGKSVNIIYYLSCTILSYCMLLRANSNMKRSYQLLITIALALNPTSVAQLFSFYNDGYLFSGISLLTLSLIVLTKSNSRQDKNFPCTVAVLISIILINTKFNHFFYCALIWFGFFIYTLFKQYKKDCFMILSGGVLATCISIGIVGFNPYITNTMKHSDPFYPLLSGNVDIMSYNTPEFIKNDNRLSAFVKTQLSTDHEEWGLVKHPLTIKNYFSTNVDARTLGFGPFFIVLFLLSIFLIIFSKPSRSIIALYVICILSGFIFSQAWWARYAPMIWATIPISLYASCQCRKWKLIRTIIFSGIIVNVICVTARCYVPQIIHYVQIQNIKNLAQENQLLIYSEKSPIINKQLDEIHVNYRNIPLDSIDWQRSYIVVGNTENNRNAAILIYDQEEASRRIKGKISRKIWDMSRIKKL